jgi:phenylacetate-CoA ligase
MQDLVPRPEDLDPIERASVDELQDLQLERLQWSLRHAYASVPHYRAAFDAAGVHPDDCKDLADLARYPLTTKADLRENYPFGMFAVPREQVVRIHASSGTTGRPTVVGYTSEDLGVWASVMAARSAPPAGGRDTCCTMPTATGCSPAGSARTTARRSSAARWCRCPAG